MLLLSPRNTQRLPNTAASTLLRLLKHRLSLREHLGGIMQIFSHRDIDMWGRVLRGRGRVSTFIKNISLVLRL